MFTKILFATLVTTATGFCDEQPCNNDVQDSVYALQVELHQALEKAEIEVNNCKDISRKLKAKAGDKLEKVRALEDGLEQAAANPDVSNKLKGKLLKGFNKIKDKALGVKKQKVETQEPAVETTVEATQE